MSDALARLLAEREGLERGLPGMVALSVSGHVALLLVAVIAPMLLPQEPPLRVADGFAVVLPRGGGGAPAPPPQVKAPEPKPEPVEQAPPPTPTVLKPPPKAEPRPDALPLPDSRRKKPRATPPPVRTPSTLPPARTASSSRAGAAATPGLEFGPPGPGVPDGSDTGGDWYLAGVQQKIWMIWNQQLKAGYTQSVGVSFTILPDGNVTGVRVTQPSGASLLDMAAQRAILNAAPFGPLPRDYGDKPRTITAVFKPIQ